MGWKQYSNKYKQMIPIALYFVWRFEGVLKGTPPPTTAKHWDSRIIIDGFTCVCATLDFKIKPVQLLLHPKK